MDTLKQQLLRIQQQLSGLSASQKMLTASLVAIMVMTMFYWSHYAGTAELVPLVNQSLSADEMAGIKSALQAKGVKFETVGDKIMVAPDAQFGIMSDLQFDQVLPHDMKSAFDDMIAQMSPLDSGTKTEKFYTHARERTLGMMIGRWPGVKSATVLIDTTRKNSPVNPISPSATVDIQMKSGETPSKKTVDSARASLVGTNAGMATKDVHVTINGQSFDYEDGSDPLSGENSIMKNKTEWEKKYKDKIVGMFPYIHDLYATVSVDMKTTTSESEERKVDPKQKVSVLRSENTTSQDDTQGQTGGEPGVVPNTGVSADNAVAAAPQNSHKETASNDFATDMGYRKEVTHAPAGDAVPVVAGVRVPESYFRAVWRKKNHNIDPTDAELDRLVERETPRIRDVVKGATNIKDDASITVATYVDVDEAPVPDAAAAGLAASLPVGGNFGAKEMAIGALAVISLFMVSMMVRKSAPQAQLAGAGMAPVPLGSALDVMSADKNYTSEVSEGGAMMVGHELDEDAIEAKNVIEQVDAMVKANPDAAANLLKQWMRS